MTFRSVVLGLLGAVLICAVTYFNDFVMRGTSFVGNFLPISVYGSLMLIAVINIIPFFIWRHLETTHDRLLATQNSLNHFFGGLLRFFLSPLAGRELAVMLALTLAACCIPSSGLMRTFTTSLILPYHFARTTPAWEKNKLIGEEMNPAVKRMLVDVSNTDKVLDTLVSGDPKKSGLKYPSPTDIQNAVPWKAWQGALLFWIPLILVFWIGLLGLSLVVHKQWSDHEQLPYPIAGFASSLLTTGKEAVADALRSKIFWIGVAIAILIHTDLFLYAWFPKTVVALNLNPMFNSLNTVFPTIISSGNAWWLYGNVHIYLTVIAFAFFLATDVSLALGLGPILWAIIAATLYSYGVAPTSPAGEVGSFATFGAYLGILLVLIYTGRRYYADVFKKAFFIPGIGKAPGEAVWGARIFVVSFAIFVTYISTLGGLDWPISLLYTAIAVLLFLVMSRIVAETGVFWVQTSWVPTTILLGFFGAKALGPTGVLITGILTMVLLVDPREAFMPFMVNSLKLVDQHNVKVGRFASWAVVAVLLGIAVALPITLGFQYTRGANMSDGFAAAAVPQQPFNTTVQVLQRLQAQDQLTAAMNTVGLGHFKGMAPDGKMMIAFLGGLALVLLFTFGRLRFSKWPLHPVMFLIWYTYPGRMFYFSFLLGWLIKTGVMKYGGAATYRNMKPLMIGLIAGEMLFGVILMTINLVIYMKTGQPTTHPYNILPG